ncbi:MAG TPA: PEP-CTERM sorting domain-containing protein [Pontiella sp.]|nr:PEP-CTERM sorting domain-containing protein [Pontiella sp.]
MLVKKLFIVTIVCLLLPCAHADWFDLTAITANDPSGFSQYVGESQLHMEIVLNENGQIRVLFVNDGPADSSVSQIYFDFTPEINLSLVSIGNVDGVSFSSRNVKPNDLPGGENIFAAFNSDLAVGAENPAPKAGINPGESLELIMDYNRSYDIFDALANQDLRVGLHVISLGIYSESFVNAVPEPATLPLLLSSTVALRWLRVRRTNRKNKRDAYVPLADNGERHELQWVEIHTGRNRRTLPLTRCEAALRKTRS